MSEPNGQSDPKLLRYRLDDAHQKIEGVKKDVNALGKKVGEVHTAVAVNKGTVEHIMKDVGKIEAAVGTLKKAVDTMQVRLAFVVAFVTIGVNVVFKYFPKG